MKTISYTIATLLGVLTLTACNPTKQDVGTATGAVVGGVAGNVLGHGNAVATVGGAAVGAVIGNQVGKNMDEKN